METELGEQVVELTQIGGVAVGIEHGQRRGRVSNVHGHHAVPSSRAKLQYYEDTCLYLILETQHPVLEFLLPPEEYDERDNVCQYNVHQVHLVEAIEDRGDHLDMSPKENEEY